MKKKGLLAMGLAGVLTVGMCMPVLAAEEDNTFDQSASAGKDTLVTVTKPVTYSVTIPKSVTLTEEAGGKIAVTLDNNAMLEENKGVSIELSGTDYDSSAKTLTLKTDSGSKKITSTLSTLGAEEITIPGGKVEYTLTKPTTIENAGAYKGTIQFTISYTGSKNLIETTPGV